MNDNVSPPKSDSKDDSSNEPFVPSSTMFKGLLLFGLYAVVYLGFVLLNAFAPDATERSLFAGMNVAIIYGFGLILFAIALAGVYGFLCRGATD